jgi:hypothetical protein
MINSIRKASIEDNANFNSIVQACGGQPLLKSIFGQYNYSSLIEYSYLSIIATNEKGGVAFASFNDGGINSGEMESFDELMDELRHCIPVKVGTYFDFKIISFLYMHIFTLDFKYFILEFLGD